MNGAESLVHTLADGGIEVCFANPGTSEMHFVAALDRTRRMRCVLGLFEGVVTAAADGYARMAEKPAVTLLHLAPGLANASANLHNAKKARTPMVNVVGDHAVRHLAFDAPLTGDVEGAARPFSHWVRTARTAATVANEGAFALHAAQSFPGRVATLVLPADTAWEPGGSPVATPEAAAPEPLAEAQIAAAADQLARDGSGSAIVLGFRTLTDPATLRLAAAVAERTGATLLSPTSNPRTERGGGLPFIPKIPYPVDDALALLAPVRHCVLIEAAEPVAFFAYPERPSRVLPESCHVHALARPGQCGREAIARLAERLGVEADPATSPGERQRAPTTGGLEPELIAQAVAAHLPEQAIVADEGLTLGRAIYAATRDVVPHSWLSLTGGAIGIGFPMATGAAVACPDRKVLALQADGSGMYTPQALWSQAREGLDITTVVFANRGYQSLKQELFKVGANPGRTALDMLEVGEPALDWVSLAKGMGVPGERVRDAPGLSAALGRGLASPGPYLIEAAVA